MKYQVCTFKVQKCERRHEDLTTVVEEPIGKKHAQLYLGLERFQ